MWVTVPLVSSSDDPGVQDFVGRIKANAGDDVVISHYVMTHYNAIHALKLALEKVGEPTREAAVEGLQGLTIQAPTGPVSIGPDDHHVTLNMYLAKTEGPGLDLVDSLGDRSEETVYVASLVALAHSGELASPHVAGMQLLGHERSVPPCCTPLTDYGAVNLARLRWLAGTPAHRRS